MLLRIDKERGILELDGVRISLEVLRTIATAEPGHYFRFDREGDAIMATECAPCGGFAQPPREDWN